MRKKARSFSNQSGWFGFSVFKGQAINRLDRSIHIMADEGRGEPRLQSFHVPRHKAFEAGQFRKQKIVISQAKSL